MEQLKMLWRGGSFSKKTAAGPGIFIKTYTDSDKDDLKTALLNFYEGKPPSDKELDDVILKHVGVRHEGIFLAYLDGYPVGTATGWFSGEKLGTLHMVSVDKKASGRKLGKLLCESVMEYLSLNGCEAINLTTDEPRLPAIKIYLDLGFLPVLEGEDMEKRWQSVLSALKGGQNGKT